VRDVTTFGDSAPEVLLDIEAARRFIGGLDEASDLIEAACSSAALATLALDTHLKREGKDNHARAYLEAAYELQCRLSEFAELWRALEAGE
jgi:hypothetical protein